MSVHERAWLRSATVAALINAIVLTFLGVQYVAPPAFLALLWLAPALFAVVAYLSPLRLTLLSAVVVVGAASLLFGLVTGAWAVVYVVVGCAVGWLHRWRWPGALRAVAAALALWVAVAALALAFLQVIGVGVAQALAQAQLAFSAAPSVAGQSAQSGAFGLGVVGPLAIGSAVLALIVGCAIEWLVSRVITRLPPQPV